MHLQLVEPLNWAQVRFWCVEKFTVMDMLRIRDKRQETAWTGLGSRQIATLRPDTQRMKEIAACSRSSEVCFALLAVDAELRGVA